MKGQLTQAQRLGAETVVVARADGTYQVRRRGEDDRVVNDLSEISMSVGSTELIRAEARHARRRSG